jgi:hypothetical protein
MSRSILISRGMGKDEDTERFGRDVDRLLADQPVEEEFTDDAYQADLEVANLLGRVQFTPDPRFRSRLRSQLLHQLSDEEVQRMSPMKVFRSLARPVLVAGLSAVLVLAVVFAASPDVRAAAQETARDLVARFVEVDSPLALLFPQEKGAALPTTLPAPDGQVADAVSIGTGELPELAEGELPALSNEGVEIEPGKLPLPDALPSRELVSLEEAQAGLDFEILMPSALPEGYSFLGAAPRPELSFGMPGGADPPPDLPKTRPPQVVMLVFGNSAGDVLMLSEMLMNDPAPAPAEVPLPAGEGSVQEVTVNGQPAQYIEGMWSPSGWVSEGHHQLHWQAGGIMFDLISPTLGLDDLLAVAESLE